MGVKTFTMRKRKFCPHAGCDYTTVHATHLTNHVRTHTGERPFPCQEPGCDLLFARQADLTRHMLTHTGERPFPCHFSGCDKAFARKQHLTRHERTHSGERPYCCPSADCDYTCIDASTLSRHEQVHSGVRPYKCIHPGCDKSFFQYGTLRNHEQTHLDVRPFLCPYPDCGQAFVQKGNLVAHLRTHTGEKPFLCPFPGCDQAFSHKSNVTTHVRTHTGERPFVCQHPDCGEAFSLKVNLQKHEEALHTDEGRQRRKRSEQATADVLQEAGIVFKREHRTTHDCLGSTWSSTDFLIEPPGGLVDLEHDEGQHSWYGVACETARMLKIFHTRALAGCTLPQMFVRFNPDAFKVDGHHVKGIRQDTRRRALAAFLKTVDLRGAPPLQIVYMYYDAVTVQEQLRPTITTDPGFHECLNPVVSWLAPASGRAQRPAGPTISAPGVGR